MAEDKKQQGIQALNQDFIRYDQVEKKQTYHLAEHAADDPFDEDYQIKVCDMSGLLRGDVRESRRFAEELGAALKDIGFAILTGPTADEDYYRGVKQAVEDFFDQTTLEQRLSYRARRFGSVNQGYFPIEETSAIHPDLVEGWVFCRRAFNFENRCDFPLDRFWPIPAMEPFFREYIQRHEALFVPIMRSILSYLGCDPHLYDRKLSGTNFGFRMNYYPPLGETAARSGAGRILGHEDVDLFTLLPAPDIEGLQVLNRKNSQWIRLHAPPGSIILNSGDYLQRISNDILPSTTHRVSQPRDPGLKALPRISFPIAVYVWEQEMLEVLPGLANPKYEPIKAINFHTSITSKFYGDDYAVLS